MSGKSATGDGKSYSQWNQPRPEDRPELESVAKALSQGRGPIEPPDPEEVRESIVVSRPADVVDLRQDLCTFWRHSDYLRRMIAMQGRYSNNPDSEMVLEREGELTRRWLYGTLREAELYWVSPDMSRLIGHIAPSMPDIVPEPPVPEALVVFARPIMGTDSVDDRPIFTVAFLWGDVVIEDINCLGIETFGWRDLLWPRGANWQEVLTFRAAMSGVRLIRTGGSEWVHGHLTNDFTVLGKVNRSRSSVHVEYGKDTIALREDERFDPIQQASMMEDRRVIAAFWSLVNDRITVERQEPMTRAVRRRMQRANLPQKPVRVITLRETRRTESGEGRAVDWSHRWIVGGHWKQQPYGPRQAYRRAQWIAPFVKGPADKPLVIRETVRALKR
jgi:hypothetical protein